MLMLRYAITSNCLFAPIIEPERELTLFAECQQQ